MSSNSNAKKSTWDASGTSRFPMTRPKDKSDQAFASYKMPTVQNRDFLMKKAKNGPMVFIRHMVGRHVDISIPCVCGFTDQEIVDKMDWERDIPSSNSFYYQSHWREYPRLIRLTPQLDHMKYLRRVALHMPVTQVLKILTSSQYGIPFEELEPELNHQFKGSYWENIYQTWRKLDKSHQTQTMNRWMSCPSTKNFAQEFKRNEAMLEVMTS